MVKSGVAGVLPVQSGASPGFRTQNLRIKSLSQPFPDLSRRPRAVSARDLLSNEASSNAVVIGQVLRRFAHVSTSARASRRPPRGRPLRRDPPLVPWPCRLFAFRGLPRLVRASIGAVAPSQFDDDVCVTPGSRRGAVGCSSRGSGGVYSGSDRGSTGVGDRVGGGGDVRGVDARWASVVAQGRWRGGDRRAVCRGIWGGAPGLSPAPVDRTFGR
jgi:hypothetical protein